MSERLNSESEYIKVMDRHVAGGVWYGKEELPTIYDYRIHEVSGSKRLADPRVMTEEKREEAKIRMEELGLENIGYSIMTRHKLPDKPNYYVLAHGWTATREIYTEVKPENGLTVAEQIMALDPNAVIIAMDGNGFGETRFKESVIKDKDKLAEKCNADAYAEQIDFLVTQVLDLDRSQVQAVGHSMAGDAVMELASRGYSATAIAPARFLTEEDSTELDTYKKLEKEKVQPLLYSGLALGTGLASGVGKIGAIGRNISEISVEKTFQVIRDWLMGSEFAFNEPILKQLLKIHKTQLTADRLRIVSETIRQLQIGRRRTWSEEEITNLEGLEIIAGGEDTLVPPQNLRRTLEFIEMKLIKANIDKDSKAMKIFTGLKKRINKHFIKDGSHYGVFYNKNTASTIVGNHPNNRAKGLAG